MPCGSAMKEQSYDHYYIWTTYRNFEYRNIDNGVTTAKMELWSDLNSRNPNKHILKQVVTFKVEVDESTFKIFILENFVCVVATVNNCKINCISFEIWEVIDIRK